MKKITTGIEDLLLELDYNIDKAKRRLQSDVRTLKFRIDELKMIEEQINIQKGDIKAKMDAIGALEEVYGVSVEEIKDGRQEVSGVSRIDRGPATSISSGIALSLKDLY